LNILPLILDKTAFPQKYFSFGSADNDPHPFAIQYFDHIYQLVQWPYIYQFNGEKGTGLYDLRTDSLMNVNIIHENKNASVALRMDSLVKSAVQQYNHALITNSTHIK
jgi:hypothetical protein